MPVVIASKPVTDLTPDIFAIAPEAVSIAAFGDSLYMAVCRSVKEESSDATDENAPIAIAEIHRYSDADKVWQRVEQHALVSTTKAELASTLRCQLSAISGNGQTKLIAHFCGFGAQLLLAASNHNNWQEWPSPVENSALIESGLSHQGRLYLRSVASDGRMSLLTAEYSLDEDSASSPERWQSVALPESAEYGAAEYSAAEYSAKGPVMTAWVSCADGIYGAIANPTCGFELWHLSQPSERWHQVHSSGLQRYSLNAQVRHMVPFQGSLYLVTAQASENPLAEHALEPVQIRFELIRLYDNGDWDLLAGQPRFTPLGLRVPLLCKGPGFDSASGDAAYLVVHQNRLYLGFQSVEGFQLWRSSDGEVWTLLAVPELSQYHQLQQFETASTPFGLAMACDAQTVPGAQSLSLFLYRDSDCM